MSQEIIYSASWLLNPDASPVAGGALLVKDGTIIESGTLSVLRRRSSAPVIDYPGCALLPGFVNAHTHLELTHFPSWLHKSSVDYAPRRFTDWIIQLIKISRGLPAEAYPPSIREGVRMCLESGTTAIGEIVTNPSHSENYYHSPLAGRLYFELLGQEPGHFRSRLSAAVAAAVQGDDGNVLMTGLSPHSPYTIAHGHLAAICNESVSHCLPLAIHLSESRAETDFIFDGNGDIASDFYPFVGWDRFLGRPACCSSAELLDRYGLLTSSTLAVHCVHVSAADVRLIKSRGTHIVLCPRSNELLDVGRAPVKLFRESDIPLALGTDSLASNNSLSLWDELRFALEIFSSDLSEQDLFRMVTAGGAAGLGISSFCGTLEAGKRADFQVVGNCEGDDSRILERAMRAGTVQEVYVSGKLFSGCL